jgi:phosphatidate cytidylyltransferase
MLWGLVMAAVALALTWSGLLPFAGLVLAVALVVSWEWGRIVRRSEGDLILAIHGLAVVAAVALAVAGLTALALVVLAIGTILAALLGFDRLGRLSALGVLYAGLPAVALVWLRASRPLGLEAILFLFAVVWATDTGAYAAGRMFGGPRLIPSLSPNKTWSGLAGGVLASLVVALAFAAVVPGARSLWLAPLAIGLAIVSQGGDLMESALKRWHGVKDASGLIPGHGGVMDRVDGLIFAAVALALLGAALDVMAPARALLTGVR